MWRDLAFRASVVLAFALFVGFAWLTRHPDSAVLERARGWPLIGPVATRFRAAYLPPERSPVEAEGTEQRALEAQREVVVEPQPQVLGSTEPRDRLIVWVEADTQLHAEPSTESLVIATFGSLSNVQLLGSQGDWYQVRKPLGDSRHVVGWVYLPDYQEPTAQRLNTPEPVLPLPASPPDPNLVAAARRQMAGGGTVDRCGPYALYTDVTDQEALRDCRALAGQLESVFRQRYGVEPVGDPAEAILLFASESDYLAFRDDESGPIESRLAHARPSRGYVALHVGDRPRDELASTLIHELSHLITRRTIGPALPPWLAEGLADDLAESRIDASGSLQPGLLGGRIESVEGRLIYRGAMGSLASLGSSLEDGTLPGLRRLLGMSAVEFYRSGSASRNYALSSFWVRYLLSGFSPTLADGFRSFLGAVAAGEPITEELLLGHLDGGYPQVEAGFHAWLRLQSMSPQGAEASPQ
jgi:hypothetical protein